MASPLYVDDDGDDSDGLSWATAYQLLDTGLLNVDAGGIIYIGSDHAETEGANYTLASANGTAAAPVNIISADKTSGEPGEPPTTYETMLTGGGSINAGAGFDLIFSGWDIYVGLTFTSGDDFIVSTASLVFQDCEISVDDNLSVGGLAFAAFYDCLYKQVTFGALSANRGSFLWSNVTFSFDGGSLAYLLTVESEGNFTFQDCDLSGLAAADYLVNANTSRSATILFKRCKVPSWAGGGLINSQPTGEATSIKFHSVSASDIIYQLQENYLTGQINEDTVIYRAATYDGTNEYSIKMVSNTNAVEWSKPLRFKLAEVWAAANPTLTVHFNLDQAATIQNDELWFEVEYPDDTIGALGTVDKSSRPVNILTAAGDQGSAEGDPGGWTEAFANPQARSKAITIANGQAGVYTIWACLAKPSTTVYVCPKIVVA